MHSNDSDKRGHKSPALLSVGPLAHTASTDNTVSLIIPVSPGPKHSSSSSFFLFFPLLDPHRCSIRDKCLYAIRSAAPITSIYIYLSLVPRNVAEVNCCKLRLHKEPTVISQAVSPHKLLQTKPRDERNAWTAPSPSPPACSLSRPLLVSSFPPSSNPGFHLGAERRATVCMHWSWPISLLIRQVKKRKKEKVARGGCYSSDVVLIIEAASVAS